MQTLLNRNNIMPLYQNFDEDISIDFLKNENEYLVFIINHNSKEKDNISIKFPFLKKFNYEIFYQNESDKNISFIGEKLIITHLTSGIIIRLRIEE